MNLPNKLTLFRVILIPIFVFLMLYPLFGLYNKWVVLGIFILACLTDFADGRIARKYDLVTNFGKFADPLADKLLVCSALICLVGLNDIPAWAVVIIIAREFVVSGLRLVAADAGIVISASWWGKVKTSFQMIFIILTIANIISLRYLTYVIFWFTLAFTLVSMFDYIWQNRKIFTNNSIQNTT